MIKRIVGLLAAAAVIVVVVFTILGYGTYSSLIGQNTVPAATSVAAPDPIPVDTAPDTIDRTVTVETTAGGCPVDSLSVGNPAADSPDSPADPLNR